MKRLSRLLIAGYVSISALASSSGLAQSSTQWPVNLHEMPVIIGTLGSETLYKIDFQSGLLDENGKFRVSLAQSVTIPESGINFYFSVAYKYVSTTKPMGVAGKPFKVKGTFKQLVGDLVVDWYEVAAKNAPPGASLSGRPAKIYKGFAKAGNGFGKAAKASGASADRAIKSGISGVKKSEKLLRAEVNDPATNVVWPPSIIKSPKKILSLAERALRTKEERKRDLDLQAAQNQINKLNRKLESIAGR